MGNILVNENLNGETLKYFYEEGKGNSDVFRKTVHDIMVKKQDIVKGERVYTNQLKAFCTPVLGGFSEGAYDSIVPKNDLNADNIVNISLPSIVNTMTLNNNSQKEVRTIIGKDSISLNINHTTSTIDETMENKMKENEFKCQAYMEDLCAKQVYNNDCFILINGIWMWNYKNSRCITDDLREAREVGSAMKIKFKTIDDGTNDSINYGYNNNTGADYNTITVSPKTLASIDYLFTFINNIGPVTTNDFENGATLHKYINDNFGFRPNTEGDFKRLSNNNIAELNEFKNALFVNYMYKFEMIIKKPLSQDRIINTGDQSCGCLNSQQGINFNSYPSDKCPLYHDDNRQVTYKKAIMLDVLNWYDQPTPAWANIDSNMISRYTQYDHLRDRLTNQTEDSKRGIIYNYLIDEGLKIKEIKACLGYNYYNDNGQLVKPFNYTSGMTLYDDKSNKLVGFDGIDLNLADPNSYENRYNFADTYYHMKQAGKERTTYGQFKAQNTNELSNSIYSMKLGATSQGTDPKTDIDVLKRPSKCLDLLQIESRKNQEKPFYQDNNISKPDNVCINQINISNSIARDINFNNIIQANVCGNDGNVIVNFPQPEDDPGNNYSCITSSDQHYIILSNFTININNNNFVRKNSINSKYNGLYISCKSPLISQEIQKCSQATNTNIYVKTSDPSIFISFKQDSDGGGYSTTIYQEIMNVPVPILISKSFKYSTTNPSGTEQVCVSNTTVSHDIFKKYLTELTKESRAAGDATAMDNINQTETDAYRKDNYLPATEQPVPNYRWLSDTSLFDDLMARDDTNELLNNVNGVISRSVRDARGDNVNIDDRLISGTKFLLGMNQNIYFLVCKSDTDSIWGCGTFEEDINNLNSFMVLNENTFNYNQFKNNTYENLKTNNIYDLNLMIGQLQNNSNSIIIYYPSIYRYLLIKKINNRVTVLAASEPTNEVIGRHTSKTFNSNKLKDIEESLLVEGGLYVVPESKNVNKEWTIYAKKDFDGRLGNIISENIFTIILKTGDVSIFLNRHVSDNPYSFVNKNSSSSWSVEYSNNKWIIQKNNVLYYIGNTSEMDFRDEPEYWRNLDSSISNVSIISFSDYVIQIEIDKSVLPVTNNLKDDIVTCLGDPDFFNTDKTNPARTNIANININLIKSESDMNTNYILIKFNTNRDKKDIRLQYREYGYLINKLINFIPYLYNESSNKLAIKNISNSSLYFSNRDNSTEETNSKFAYYDNIPKSGFLLSNYSNIDAGTYRTGSFALTMPINFTPKSGGVESNPSISSDEMILVEKYLNTVLYDTFYSIDELSPPCAIYIKNITNVVQPTETTDTTDTTDTNADTAPPVTVEGFSSFKSNYGPTISNFGNYKNSIVESFNNTVINTVFKVYFFYNRNKRDIFRKTNIRNIQTSVIPASTIIYHLNKIIHNKPLPVQLNTGLTNNYDITTIFQSISILPSNLSLPLAPALLNDNTTWSDQIFDQTEKSDILNLNILTPYDKILKQSENIFNFMANNNDNLTNNLTKLTENSIKNIYKKRIEEHITKFNLDSINLIKETMINYLFIYFSNDLRNIKEKYDAIQFTKDGSIFPFNQYIDSLLSPIKITINEDIELNILNSNTNKKFYYTQYMTLLTILKANYESTEELIIAEIQMANKEFIEIIQNDSTKISRLIGPVADAGECFTLNECITGYENLNNIWTQSVPAPTPAPTTSARPASTPSTGPSTSPAPSSAPSASPSTSLSKKNDKTKSSKMPIIIIAIILIIIIVAIVIFMRNRKMN